MTLEELYDRFGEEMYGFLALRLDTPQDAEDVLQETFFRLARYRVRWSLIRSPRAFIFRVLRNESHRFLSRALRRSEEEARRSRQMIQAAAVIDPPSPDPASGKLRAALAALPGEQREVIILKVFEDFSFKEIGRICGLSLNTAASRYRYGLQKLQSLMEGKNDQGTDA